jgi:hypothetical protein
MMSRLILALIVSFEGVSAHGWVTAPVSKVHTVGASIVSHLTTFSTE